ncbi:MAG TPA: LytTR family DNA-binding domain-containing protein [Gaiellaceae bacterium]|nr:LytTR family DNA-binding domain-containing protein [Gaiellaceae bacterium]
MIRALLVDDEAPARSELRYLLAQHRDVAVVDEAAGAAEAVELAADGRYDVVFCDVEMPGLTGLEAAALVRDRRRPPAVVFVTAHEQYAVDAFAVEAFDYLLKPVDPRRLARVLDRLRARAGDAEAAVEKIAVVAGARTELLDFDQIHYVQADGDYSRVHTFDRSYLSTASLGELEAKLPAGRFARIHRSYLVNLAKVSGVRRAAPDRVRLQLADADGTELDVARRQMRRLRERLGL